MTEEVTLYRVDEYVTTGWESLGAEAENLTKQQAKELVEKLINEGYVPAYLRAVPQNHYNPNDVNRA